MPNRSKKINSTHKHTSLISPQIITLLGVIWIVVWILLFVRTNEMNEVMSSTVFQILMLFVGGLGVSYGVVRSTQNVDSETRRSQLTRIILFALGVSVAGFVVYSWVNLFTNGL